MERDFLGLNPNDSSVVMVEDDASDGFKDNNSSVSTRGSIMQWPFSNKVSALPQFMPFKTVQEERSKKIVFDPLPSSGFMPVSTSDAFNGVVQKNINFDRQGGNQFSMNGFPVDAHRPHDNRAFVVSNHTMSIAMNNPFFKTNVTSTGHNFTSMKQQPLGGIPITTPRSVVPLVRSMIGNVEQRNASEPTMASNQLTIFYGGSVNVYNDVSPEKAQAIMFLAGNGSSKNMNTTTSKTQVQALIPKSLGGDGAHINQSYSSHCSGLSSPMSVTSHASGQSGSGSNGADDLMAVKSIGDFTAPINQPEPPKAGTPLASAAPTMIPAAVPQARKASLARFLEKRKERVMNTMPYNMNKKPCDGSTTPASNNVNLSGNYTEAGGSIPASKGRSWSLGPTKDEKSN